MATVEIAEEFDEMFRLLADNGLLGGVYLGKPTGEVLEEDNTFIEIMLANKSFFAKPCFSFGGWNAPNKEWLKKYKDEIMVWVAFENGNDAHAVYLGVQPLNEKVPAMPYLRGKNWKSTKFSYYFDDTDGVFTLFRKDDKEKFIKGIEINDTEIKISDKKGNFLVVGSNGQVSFKNWKGQGIKTTDTTTVLGKGEGLQNAIKGTQHITNIQSILTQMVTTPMIVNPTTMMASFPPPLITSLTEAISKLTQDLSDSVKLD